MYKVIMFDFDGVILDSVHSSYLIWKQITEEFDAKVKIKNI